MRSSFNLNLFVAHLLTQEQEQLEHSLQLNRLLADLRRRSLQSLAVRAELDTGARQAERDRAVMAKWRKSRAYVSASSSNSSGGGGGGGAGAVGAGGGGGAVGAGGKAKSSHKKKHGGY